MEMLDLTHFRSNYNKTTTFLVFLSYFSTPWCINIICPLLCQALSERLFYYIAVSLLSHDTLCELEAAVEAGRALSPILQWHKHPNDYFSKEAQTLYFNSLRTYWQELIDLTRWESEDTQQSLKQQHWGTHAGSFINFSETGMLSQLHLRHCQQTGHCLLEMILRLCKYLV